MAEEKQKQGFFSACWWTGVVGAVAGAMYGGIPWAIAGWILGIFAGAGLYVGGKLIGCLLQALIGVLLLVGAVWLISAARS